MSTTKSKFRKSLQYLILERRVQVTLPRRHVNEEAAGKYGHIVDIVECEAQAKFCPVVETDDGEHYTCYPSALEVAEKSGSIPIGNDPLGETAAKMKSQIEEALAVDVIKDGDVSYKKALSEIRNILVEALQ